MVRVEGGTAPAGRKLWAEAGGRLREKRPGGLGQGPRAGVLGQSTHLTSARANEITGLV